MEKSIKELEREYDLEIDKIAGAIKKQKAKRVLLQFPDGLKPYADVIASEIEKSFLKKKPRKETKKPEFFIWFGSCFGACDVPLQTEKLGVDLIVQFGHSAWKNHN